jgi:hypothetical protein
MKEKRDGGKENEKMVIFRDSLFYRSFSRDFVLLLYIF